MFFENRIRNEGEHIMNGGFKTTSRRLAATVMTVIMASQIAVTNPRKVEAATPAYSEKPVTDTYNYGLNTNDNLIAPWNSMMESQINNDNIKNGLVGKFTFDNWQFDNVLNGRRYSTSLSGIENGYYQGGMMVNGGNTKIPMSDMGINGSTNDVTVAYWYKWDGHADASIPFGFQMLSMDFRPSVNVFGINTANGEVYGMNNPFKVGQWTHILVHFKAHDIKGCEMYVNGIKQSLSYKVGSTTNMSQLDFSSSVNPNLWINSWGLGNDYCKFDKNSIVDEFMVWNRALSNDDVQNLYRSYGGAGHSYSYLNDMKFKASFDNTNVSNPSANPPVNDVNNTKFTRITQPSYSYDYSKKGTSLVLNSGEHEYRLGDMGFTGQEQYLTCAFWMKSKRTGKGVRMAVRFISDPSGVTDIIERDVGGYYLGLNTGNGDYFATTNPFNDEQWHHIVVTYKIGGKSTDQQMYVDGHRRYLSYIDSSRDSGGNYNFTANTKLVFSYPADYSYEGQSNIDEFEMWNRKLSDEEISSLFKSYGNGGSGYQTGYTNFNSYWDTFAYQQSDPSSIAIQKDDALGLNYLHITGQGNGLSTGAILKADNLKKNTWYTASAYMRTDSADNYFGFGALNIVDTEGAGTDLGTSSPSGKNMTNQWIRVSVPFYTKDVDKILMKINRGNHKTLDVTSLKLEEGRNATPVIGYNETRTYGYGLMDNLISPHDSCFSADKWNSTTSNGPINNWTLFNSSGSPSATKLLYGSSSPNGENSMFIYPQLKNDVSDSGVYLDVGNLEKNTDYTVSSMFNISTGSTGTDPITRRLLQVEDMNGAAIGTFNFNNKNNQTNKWERLSGTFNTGSNTKIRIRITRGNIPSIFFTNVTLTGGKEKISKKEVGGYNGYVTPQKVTFTPAGGVVEHHDASGSVPSKTVTLSDSYTDGQYHLSTDDFSRPYTVKAKYTDPASGNTYSFDISRSGSPTVKSSTNQTVTEWQNQWQWGYIWDESRGSEYDPSGHTTLGYMSDNAYSYYGGSYLYSRDPRKPNDYYGNYPDDGNWELVEIRWDDSYPVDSFDYAYEGWYWTSDTSSGSYQNRYRKGVYLKWRKKVWTQVAVPVQVSKTVYQYSQNYQGTVSIPATQSHFQDYTINTKWNVKVDYAGTMYPTNLKADMIGITDEAGNSTSRLQAGKTYKANVTFSNNGYYDVTEPFSIGLYLDSISKNNSLNGITFKDGIKAGETKMAKISFTVPASGFYKIVAKVDDANVIDEVNELDSDNTVSTNIEAYSINIAATNIQIVGPSDDTPQLTLQVNKNYRAKIRVRNVGGVDVGKFNVGLYTDTGTTPPEESFVFPSPAQQIGSNFAVDGLKTDQYIYAYVPFTATSTDIKQYIGWADNSNEIKESNEYDNLVSAKPPTIAYNAKANNITIVNLNDDTPQTSLIKGLKYRAKVNFENTDPQTALIPLSVGIYEGDTNGNRVARSTYLMSPLQKRVEYIPFTATDESATKYTLYVDCDEVYTETTETDNRASTPVKISRQNLKANSLKVFDGTTEVSELVQNCKYEAEVEILNDGNTDITEPFNTGLKYNGTLQDGKPRVNSLAAGAKTTVKIPFTATTTGKVTLEGIVDIDNEVPETNEDDNSVSKLVDSNNVNLATTFIDIVGTADDTPREQLQQGLEYRCKVLVVNNGQKDINNFTVSLNENTVEIGSQDVASLKTGESTTLYFTFKEKNRGNVTFSAFADSKNVIKESNENDNKKDVSKNAFVLNLKALNVDIVDMASDAPVANPIEKKQYRARIEYVNDGDTDVLPCTIGLYDSDAATGKGTRIGVINVEGTKKGEKKVAYVSFIANNRGNRTFKAKVDDDDKIIESNEADNEVTVSKTVQRRNVKAASIKLFDDKGEPQNTLITNRTYKAKVELVNDGDIPLTPFDLGIYDKESGKKLGSLSIPGMNVSATPSATTVYEVPFVPVDVGSRTIEAFADDTNLLDESDETDNKASTDIKVSNMSIFNFRINDIRDPMWKDVFRDSSNNLKGYEIKSNQMAVDKDSHPAYADYVTKKGYSFYYKVNSYGMDQDTDCIEVTPKFYSLSKDSATRTEVDIYYNQNNQLVKIGGKGDSTVISDDSKNPLGSFTKQTLTKANKTMLADEQEWSGKYYVPANSIIVPKGKLPTDENTIKDGFLLINFDARGIKQGFSRDAAILDWAKEGNPKKNSYKCGDVMLFDNKYNALNDLKVNVTH